MKYLNPKADLTFKHVFGEHPEMVPENPLRKNSIVDVRCKDKEGRLFLVEMRYSGSAT